jgi:hypothetical protein
MRGVWRAASLGLLLEGACTDRPSGPAPPVEGARPIEQAPAPAERPAISFEYDDALARRLTERNEAWPDACASHPRERIGLDTVLHRESSVRPVPLDLTEDLVRVVEGLPRPFFELFERHVCAVVLMHGAPMTGTLSSLDSDRTRSIILLDMDKLQLSPNEWLAFKESSAFAVQPDTVITGTLTGPSDNPRRVLIEFLLVHELGHVLDTAFPQHLLIDDFKSISWPRQDALADAPLTHYPSRKGQDPLPATQLETYYDIIAAGAFSSPATATSPKEDFAESLATFMHTVMRDRPWQLQVRRKGKVVRQISACWAEPRCRAKRDILEELLRRWSQQ